MMKILVMCEGPNELKIINLLLDNDKLRFTRDELLDMRPFHAKQLTSPQLIGHKVHIVASYATMPFVLISIVLIFISNM